MHIGKYFPRIISKGTIDSKNLSFFVMPKYDFDLQRMLYLSKKGLSLETVVTIGLQGLERLEALHNCQYLHNDLKP